MIQILGLVLLWTGAAAGLQCTVIPGILKQIDAGAGGVFGVNYEDEIFQWMGTDWRKIPGKLIHVTVGPAGVWGVDEANSIYRLDNDNWVTVSGLLKQIDAGGDKFLSGVNGDDLIFCLNQGQTVSKSVDVAFIQLEGALEYYSCGPYGCWGVNSANTIYYRYDVKPNSCQGSRWQQIDGSLVMVEVGTDGSVYGVNPKGYLFKREGISACNPTGTFWTIMDFCGTLQHVSYDDRNLWLLGIGGDIYKCKV